MGVTMGSMACLCLLFFGFIVQDVLATSHGSKLTGSNAKFPFTSKAVTTRSEDLVGAGMISDIQGVGVSYVNGHIKDDLSTDEGVKCFRKLAGRSSCLDYEPEDGGYCGIGIMEADDHYDCETSVSCIEQRRDCTPRDGINQCRFIGEDKELCLSSVKCRGCRFLYDLEQTNVSQFISNVSEYLSSSRDDQGMDVEPPGMWNDPPVTSQAPPERIDENPWFIFAQKVMLILYILVEILREIVNRDL